MAFKMKGPMFFKSALKNVSKKGYEESASFQHRVDDNPEHRNEYGANHSDNLQTEEEHKAAKNKGKDGLASDRVDAAGGETPMAHRRNQQLGASGKSEQLVAEHNKTAGKPGHHDYKQKQDQVEK